MPQQKPLQGAKRKWRKGRYLKGYKRWVGVHQQTRQLAARSARRSSSIFLNATNVKATPDENVKRMVASNRCGNGCGRRAAMDDYLCWTCRNMHS